MYITLGKRLKQLPPVLSEEFVDELTTFEWFNEIHNLYFLSDKTRMVPIQEGMQRMYTRFLPYVEQLVQENEKRDKTTDKLLPQHNYLKNHTNERLSVQEIVMSTLDVILGGTRSVSHKHVIIVFGNSYRCYSQQELFYPILFWIPYSRSLSFGDKLHK